MPAGVDCGPRAYGWVFIKDRPDTPQQGWLADRGDLIALAREFHQASQGPAYRHYIVVRGDMFGIVQLLALAQRIGPHEGVGDTDHHIGHGLGATAHDHRVSAPRLLLSRLGFRRARQLAGVTILELHEQDVMRLGPFPGGAEPPPERHQIGIVGRQVREDR